MTIPSPITLPHHPDHLVNCRTAIESHFKALADRASAAGWDAATIVDAMHGLANSYRDNLNEAPPLEPKLTIAQLRQAH